MEIRRYGAGCIKQREVLRVESGHYRVGPDDWDSEHQALREGDVEAFWLDAVEVTEAAWQDCVAARVCPDRSTRASAVEPGLPVVNVTPEQAQHYCRWATGRLPRSAEWLLATTGSAGRRFPWGQTGLVCRRAVFGLARGPCAEGGTTPDLAGSRPDGKTSAGVYDLVGNVAELVETAPGAYEIRGGSFRSTHASELKSWSSLPYTKPQDDVGFRCAYDEKPTKREANVDAEPQKR
jgi:formylglycine-generating enzyme required for sulfatase activity